MRLELLAKPDPRAARTRMGISPRTPVVLPSPTSALHADRPDGRRARSDQDSALASEVVPPSRELGCTGRPTAFAPRRARELFPDRRTDRRQLVSPRRERFRLADPTTGLRIQWEEVPQQTNGIAGRGVRVEVSRCGPVGTECR